MGGRGGSSKKDWEDWLNNANERRERNDQYYNDWDDPVNPDYRTPFAPYQSPNPLPDVPIPDPEGLVPDLVDPTPLEKSASELLSDLINGIADGLDAILQAAEDLKNEFLEASPMENAQAFWEENIEPLLNDLSASWNEAFPGWQSLDPMEQAAILLNVISVASIPFTGPVGPGLTLYARIPLAAMLAAMTSRRNTEIAQLSWTEAGRMYNTAEIVAGKKGLPIPDLGLQPPAKLGQMNPSQLEAELARTRRLPQNDFVTSYQNTIQQMLTRSEQIRAGQTPPPNHQLPPDTHPTPDVNLTPIEQRIITPPETPAENTAIVVSNPQAAQDASLRGKPITVVGSRDVSPADRSQIERIALALKRADCPITTGCATGVDEIMAPHATKIKAQFGPDGEGAIPASNVHGVKQAEANGAQVDYKAGGDPNTFPIKGRLVNRANAAVDDTHATLGIVTQDVSVGTMNSLNRGAANGNTVYAISTTGRPLPPLKTPGHWQKVENARGIWEGLHQWVPDPG